MSYTGLELMLEESGFSTEFIKHIMDYVKDDPDKYLQILKTIDEINSSSHDDDRLSDKLPKRQ